MVMPREREDKITLVMFLFISRTPFIVQAMYFKDHICKIFHKADSTLFSWKWLNQKLVHD